MQRNIHQWLLYVFALCGLVTLTLDLLTGMQDSRWISVASLVVVV